MHILIFTKYMSSLLRALIPVSQGDAEGNGHMTSQCTTDVMLCYFSTPSNGLAPCVSVLQLTRLCPFPSDIPNSVVSQLFETNH